jgi:succinoglycan biosynthesis transport protein ExoP
MNYSRGNAGDGGEAAPGGLVPVSQQALLGRDPYSIAVPYGVDATADGTPVFGLSLHEYLRILIKRKWLILSILGAAVVIGTLTTLMKTPLYTSTVRMQIDPNTAKIVQSGDVTPVEGPNADFMRTQFELLNGRTMAERVASALKLGEDQDFFRPRNFSITGAIFKIVGLGGGSGGTANKSDRESAAASVVLGNRAVRPVMGSRLVDIDYSDPSPAHCIGLRRRLRRFQSR